MKRARIILVLLALLCAAPCYAADQIDALITITNNPVMSNTLTVNSWTRIWTTNMPTTVQFGITNTPNKNATNMWQKMAATPFTNNLTITFPKTNAVRISARAGTTLSVTATGGWASVTFTTNSQGTQFPYSLPLSAEPNQTQATNMANYNVDALNTYATTKLLDSLLQDRPITNTEPAGGSLGGTYPSPTISAGVTNTFASTNYVATQLGGYVGTNAFATTNANFQAQIDLKLPITGTNVLASTNFVLATVGGYVGTNTFASTNANFQSQIDLKLSITGTNSLASTNFVLSVVGGYVGTNAWTSTNATLQADINRRVVTNVVHDALGIRDGGLLTNVTASATNAPFASAGHSDTNLVTTRINIFSPSGASVVTNFVNAGTNTYWILPASSSGRYVIVTNNATIAINNTTETLLTFSHAAFDASGMHADGSSDLVAAATKPHSVFVAIEWDGHATGFRYCYLRQITGSTTNNWPVQTGTAFSGGQQQQTLSAFVPLTAGDKMQVIVWQNSGGNLNCVARPFSGLTFGMYELP